MEFVGSSDMRRTVKYSQLPKLFSFSIALAAVILLVDLAVVLFVGEERSRMIFLDLTNPLWTLLATMALFYAAKRSALYSHRLSLAWGVLALTQVSFTCGNIIFAVLEIGQDVVPFPSLADGFYLAYYPLFLLGVLLLPARRLKLNDWFKTVLDMSIVLFAAALGFWNYLLGPLAASLGEQRLLAQLASLAFPVGDLVLLWALLTLIYRQTEKQMWGPLVLLALGTAIMIIADCHYVYQSMLGTYEDGSWPDVGWVLSYLLSGLAGIWQAVSVQSPATSAESSAPGAGSQPKLNSWITYFPYIWVVVAYLLLARSHVHPMPVPFFWMALGVGGIIGFVLVRQMLTLKENGQLLAQVYEANAQISQQALELRQINQELQLEIDERKRVEKQLAHDALHDALTDLPNRILFMDRLGHALDFAKRHEQYSFCVLFLDLDSFKVVNDSLGHTIGDQLLIAFAHRLRMCVRMSDTVARLGGDEFVILLEDTAEVHDATHMTRRIQEALKLPFHLDGHQIIASVSIGIVAHVKEYDRPEEILRDADLAMYHAKALGKARSETFNVRMRDEAMNRLELEHDLRHALERQELALYYQPIVTLQSNHITGFEALLRWHHPTRGLVNPGEFLSIAEETGLIVSIGQWVLYEACRQLCEWQRQFPRTPPLTMNVNISAKQLCAPDFIEQVDQVLQKVGLDPHSLRLELTEGVYLNGSEEVIALFKQLNSRGIQFHIDDFGTGYSSLAYLQHFPIQTIKIDQAFVSRLGGTGNNADIVRAVIAMAHDLGMDTVAEGVETVEQLNRLQELGCNYGQGYLLSRPVAKEEIEALLNAPIVDSAPQPKSTKPA